MVLDNPAAMNRSLDRENPDVLILMSAAGEQIKRDDEKDEVDQREGEGMGPLRPATEMSGTARKSNDLLPACDSSSASGCKSDMLKVPVEMTSGTHNPVAIYGIASTTTPNALTQSDSYGIINQAQNIAGYPALQVLQGNSNNDLHMDHEAPACAETFTSDDPALASELGRFYTNEDTNFLGQFAGGTLVPAASLATLLGTRNGLQNDLNSHAVSTPSSLPADTLRSFTLGDTHSSLTSSLHCDSNRVVGDRNENFNFSEFPSYSVPAGKASMSNMLQSSSQFMGNLKLNELTSSNIANSSLDQPRGSFKYKGLSLSLDSSQPCVVHGTTIPDCYSEVMCYGDARHCLPVSGFGSEQNSCNSRDLSLSVGSYKTRRFAQDILGSRYLHVIQEILGEIASCSLENLDLNQMNFLTSGTGTGQILPMSSTRSLVSETLHSGPEELSDVVDGIEVGNDIVGRRQAVELKKTRLLTLLQAVDDSYSQCLDEIHTVVSAFHAATELDPNVHACFALRTMSSMYRNLRERISEQILVIGALLNDECPREERIPVTSYAQKQWAIRQFQRKEHQLWRPQRGLPERSVAVLRAWMFQNFLHPYPKDSEKHLLALKSGLTRSQVSNWFINARVRLWKPLIEEMYSEMNKRKAQRNEGGANGNYRSPLSINNQRFEIN